MGLHLDLLSHFPAGKYFATSNALKIVSRSTLRPYSDFQGFSIHTSGKEGLQVHLEKREGYWLQIIIFDSITSKLFGKLSHEITMQRHDIMQGTTPAHVYW